MNVIFLDLDGVLYSLRGESFEQLEERVKILSRICKETDSKVVLSAGSKNMINGKTNRPKEKATRWMKTLFVLFDQNDIECIGKTPNVERRLTDFETIDQWKEDEIRKYLFNHPEVDHYCVIDDDDYTVGDDYSRSELNKVRAHLVETSLYSPMGASEECLLERHIDEVKEVMKLDNEIKRFALKKQLKRNKC